MTEEVRQAVLEVAAGTEAIRLPQAAAGKPGDDQRPAQAAVTKGESGRVFQWIIPIMLAGVVALGLTLYYKYEQSVNQEVTALQQQAKKEALAGRYSEAVQLLERAEEQRPRFAALTRDRELAAKAAQLKINSTVLRHSLRPRSWMKGKKR